MVRALPTVVFVWACSAALLLGGCAHDGAAGAAADGKTCQLPSELAVDCACTTANCLLELGYIYAEAIDVPRDERRARRLYQRACAGGSTAACNNLASLLIEGRGGKRDLDGAVALYEATCRRHDAEACGNLATVYRDGRGRAANPSLAALLFQQSCRGGVAHACSGLAMLYVRGDGVPVDVQQALTLFERGCGQGDSASCEALSLFERAGSAAALEDYLRGLHASCVAGNRAACARLQ